MSRQDEQYLLRFTLVGIKGIDPETGRGTANGHLPPYSTAVIDYVNEFGAEQVAAKLSEANIITDQIEAYIRKLESFAVVREEYENKKPVGVEYGFNLAGTKSGLFSVAEDTDRSSKAVLALNKVLGVMTSYEPRLG